MDGLALDGGALAILAATAIWKVVSKCSVDGKYITYLALE